MDIKDLQDFWLSELAKRGEKPVSIQETLKDLIIESARRSN